MLTLPIAEGHQAPPIHEVLLWDHMTTQPEAGTLALHIPSKGGRKARTAHLIVRHTPVTLQPPRGHQGPSLELWAVHAIEATPSADVEAVEWLLLTTVATEDFDQACERLGWYAMRWRIEVFHRTLKSGCRIEDRRLAEAGNLQACLALDLVVAWRVLYLTHLGRQTPPDEPPTLGVAMRMVAQIGGFLGRKRDGDPGPTVLWRGLDTLSFITDT